MKRRLFTQDHVLGLIAVTTGLIVAAGAFVLWPAYTDPVSRLYTSAIGYLRVQRLLGIRMEAQAQPPVRHNFEIPLLGQGTIQCNFYNVPVIPMARVTVLRVEQGDEVKEGQLLAELDATAATLSRDSARNAVASAVAERQRVEAGSVNALVAERPEKDKATVEGFAKIVKEAEAKVEMYRQLRTSGAASLLELDSAEAELATAQTNYNEAQLNAGMSTTGLPQSKEIARNAVNNAENVLQLREEELKYYQITAPAAGVIDRVLIREGEYNQSAGNPGFIIASGVWFEADLDQRAVAVVHEGMDATVNLEAYPARPFHATVEKVIPLVTFGTGGPETVNPIRPFGTGSPEWPATFKVRLLVQADGVKLVPGMTGLVRLVCLRRGALAVPREAVSSLSAGKGVVRTVDDSGHLTSVLVSLGAVDDHFVEITGGLDSSAWVLKRNPRFLRDDDKIRVTRIAASGE